MSLAPTAQAAATDLLFDEAPDDPAMVKLLLASKAPATVRNYMSGVRKYRELAREADLPFLPDERAATAFLLHLHAGEATLAMINTCVPALTWLLALNNREDVFLQPNRRNLSGSPAFCPLHRSIRY